MKTNLRVCWTSIYKRSLCIPAKDKIFKSHVLRTSLIITPFCDKSSSFKLCTCGTDLLRIINANIVESTGIYANNSLENIIIISRNEIIEQFTVEMQLVCRPVENKQLPNRALPYHAMIECYEYQYLSLCVRSVTFKEMMQEKTVFIEND